VNRIDEIVPFFQLGPDALRRIIDRYVGEIEEVLASRRMVLKLDDEVYELLIAQGDTATFGARELRRCVDRFIRQPVAHELLARDAGPGEIRVSVEGTKLVFS